MTSKTATAEPASVASLLPVRRVGPGYMQLRNPDQIVICFKLRRGVCPWGDDVSVLTQKMGGFDKALQQLRQDEQVQLFTRRVRIDGTSVGNEYREKFVKGAPASFLDGYGPFYQVWLQAWVDGTGISNYESYAFFSVRPPVMKSSSSIITKVFGMEVSKNKTSVDIDEVSRRARSWADNLASAGITVEDMTENDINKLLIEELMLGVVDVPPESLKKGATFSGGVNGYRTIREMLTSTPWDFSQGNSYQIGEACGHVIPVAEFPETKDSLLFFKELFIERINFRISLFINGVNQEQCKEIIEGQMRKDQGTSQKGSIDNQDSIASFNERNLITQMLSRRETALAKFSLYINVFEKDFPTLLSTVERVSKMFPGHHPQEGYFEQRDLFRSALPFGRNYCPHHSHLTATCILENALSVFEDPLAQGGGIPMGSTQGGQLACIDLWSSVLTNWNTAIFGIAGKGKSFLLNLLMCRCLPSNPSIMIVDASGSYESLCKVVGGRYLKISLENPDCSINPFHCDPEELKESKGIVSQTQVGGVMGFLEVLLTESGSLGLAMMEQAVLEEAIKATYEKTYTRSNPVPLLRDMHEILIVMGNDKERTTEVKSVCKNYAVSLQPYVNDGSFANLTDRSTSVDESTDFIVFDTMNLPNNEKLKALSIFIITQYCLIRSERNKKKLKKSLLVLDEAWTLVQFPAGRNFLQRVAKTSRHLMLSSIFATQQISDILNDPQSKPLFDNASLKILLGLADSDLHLAEKVMELSAAEVGALRGLKMVRGQYSQALVLSTAQRGVLNIIPDEVALVISTTFPRERLERDHYFRKYAPNNTPLENYQALIRWANDRNNRCVESPDASGKISLLSLPATDADALKRLSEQYSPTGDSEELLRLVTNWAAVKQASIVKG